MATFSVVVGAFEAEGDAFEVVEAEGAAAEDDAEGFAEGP
ncbi:hypothetical protein GCM10020000_04540 [Streptomyces olivoverticillatus]